MNLCRHLPLPALLAVFFLVQSPLFAHAATFNRSLSVGSSGADVSALQTILQNQSYYTYPTITGYFGSATSQAVSKFQAANGLETVGIVGPQTRALLNGSSVSSSVSEPTQTTSILTGVILTRTLEVGASGVDVTALQTFLQSLGFYTYPNITGYYGSVTAAAVTSFQNAHSISPIGIVGPQTRAALIAAGFGSGGTTVVTTTTATGTATTSGGTTPIIRSGGGGGNGEVFNAPATDTTSPSILISSPIDGSTVTGSSVVFSSIATDNVGVVSVQYAVNGTNVGAAQTVSPYTLNWDSTAVSDGSYSVTATARDAAGNTTISTPVSITVSNAGPVISAVSAGSPGGTSATITWTTDEQASSEVEYGLTTSYGTVTATSSLIHSHSLLLTGLSSNTTYHYRVRSTDSVSHETISTDQTFTTATLNVPSVSVTTPGAGTTVSGMTVNISANASDNIAVAGVRFQIDGAYVGVEDTTAPYSVSWNSTSVSDGSHTASAIVRNTSGNYATSTSSFIVDNTGPVISSISAGTPSDTSVSITWNTNEAATSQVAYGTTNAYGATTTLDSATLTAHLVSIANLVDATTYHYRVISVDAQGNPTYSSDQTFLTATTLDTTPPTVSVSAPSNGTTVKGSTVALSATASDNVGVVGVQFQIDGVNSSAEDTTAPYGVTWNSTGVSDGNHTVSAVARDAAGNYATSTVTVTADNTGPVLSSISAGTPSDTSTTINWMTNESADSQVAYGTTNAYGATTTLDAALVTSHAVSLSGLTANTAYHYRIRSSDAVGNVTFSTDNTFSTTNTPDSIAPTVSMTVPSGGASVGGKNVTLTATASDNVAVAGVQFRVDGTIIGSEVTSAPYTVTWDSTATTSGSHSVFAVARDAAGNRATSTPVSFTVDNTAPVITAIATSTVTTTATITWTTNEVAASTISYGTTTSYGTASTSPALVTSHSITLTGLSGGTTYHFQVSSADAAGNVATSSDQTFVTGVTACPQGNAFNDGCPSATPNGSFQDPNFFTDAAQSGQTYVTRSPWNVAGVDYGVGYNTTTALQDPATATLPSGCVYQPTGNPFSGGPRIYCTTAVNPTFQNIDFSLHSCTLLYFTAGVTGTITVTNNKFQDGTNCDAANSYLLGIGVGTHANIVLTHDQFDGTYPALPDRATAFSDNAVGTVSTPITQDIEYDAFVNEGVDPAGTKGSYASITIAHDYFGNFNQNLSLGDHGAVVAMTPDANATINALNYSYDTAIYPSTSPGNGTVVFSILAAGAAHNLLSLLNVDHNTTVTDKTPSGAVSASTAIAEPLHMAAITTANLVDNYADPTGSFSCFSNLGDASALAGTVTNGSGGAGNTLTITDGGAGGAIYPGTTFGSNFGGITQGVIQPYGTVSPDTGLATTGTGGLGTYVMSGASQHASSTSSNWQTYNTPVGTLNVSGNVNLLDNSAITIAGVQWNSGQCNMHHT